VNAMVPVTEMAFQLFGDPGLAAQCDTALHLDLEGLANGDEQTRVKALLGETGPESPLPSSFMISSRTIPDHGRVVLHKNG
jgi:hypothetical protein